MLAAHQRCILFLFLFADIRVISGLLSLCEAVWYEAEGEWPADGANGDEWVSCVGIDGGK